MNHLNLTVAEGYLVRDPEIRTVKGNKGDVSVVSFTIASNLRGNRVAFKNCEAWDTGGELIAKHFKKGKPIRVYAEHYTDKFEKDGQTVYREKFRVNNFDFVSYGKPEDGESSSEDAPEAAPSRKTSAPAKGASGKTTRKPAQEPEGDDDEEIPF